MIIHISLVLRQNDALDINDLWRQRHQCFSVGRLHVFRAAQNKRLEHCLYYIQSSNEVTRFERNCDKSLPEGKVTPWFDLEETHQTEQILKTVDNRCSCQDPSMSSVEFVTGLCCL